MSKPALLGFWIRGSPEIIQMEAPVMLASTSIKEAPAEVTKENGIKSSGDQDTTITSAANDFHTETYQLEDIYVKE